MYFSLWKLQNTEKNFKKLVLDMQNVMHIAPNAGHTMQTDGQTKMTDHAKDQGGGPPYP